MKNLTQKNIKRYVSNSEFSYINDLLKSTDKKKILVFEVNSKKKIVLISIKKDIKNFEIENLGGAFYDRVNYGEKNEYFVISDSLISKNKNFIGYFLHGIKLKSYEFKKYKTNKDKKDILIQVFGNKNKPSTLNQLKFKALEEGIFMLGT